MLNNLNMAGANALQAQKSMLKGPCANNGFTNFIGQYGARYGYDVPSMLKGGKEWNRMSDSQKNKYRKLSKPENMERGEGGGCCMKRASCPKKRKASSCCPAPKPRCPMRRKPRCAPKSRCASKPRCPMKSRCAPKRKTCPKPRCGPKRRSRCGKPKCQSPGPITNNGYLNFLRVYRRKHCGLKPKDLVMKAARAWCRLPDCKKDRYRRQACKVTTSCRHKRRRVCTGK